MAKRSDDPSSHRRTRSWLDAVGGSAMGGFRRSEGLAHHYGADAARGISCTAGDVKEYRRKMRKITAKGPSEKQDLRSETQELKGEITTDGTAYAVGKVEEHTALGSTMPETQHFNTDDTSYTVEEYRQRRGITVEGCGDIPNPIRTFDDTRFPDAIRISRSCDKCQRYATIPHSPPEPLTPMISPWPFAQWGLDLIGPMPAGKGKVRYAIVAVDYFTNFTYQASTPMLHLQYKISTPKHIKAWHTLHQDRGGILIATPRSLLVALEDGYTNVRRVTYLVLDGADWMLEKQNMGFGSQIQDIVSKIHPDCQILLLGTSWSKEVDKRANRFLYNACNVTIVSPPLKPTHPIDQTVYVVTEDQKYNKLVELLGRIVDGSRILIFMDIKEGCEKRDQFALQLYTDGQHAVSLHENKGQAEMARIVSEFQAGRIPIMIATDVAARDIDLKDVKYVINYDFPVSLDDYVYRIDRAGSAAAKGTVFTFFTTANAVFAEELIILLKEAGQKVSSELEQLGRDVPYPGTYIPAPWRWAVNQEEVYVNIRPLHNGMHHLFITLFCQELELKIQPQRFNLLGLKRLHYFGDARERTLKVLYKIFYSHTNLV
ncbi:unnamed protein product [Malus baccata var. baccata]